MPLENYIYDEDLITIQAYGLECDSCGARNAVSLEPDSPKAEATLFFRHIGWGKIVINGEPRTLCPDCLKVARKPKHHD